MMNVQKQIYIFEAYLKERGLFIGDEEDDIDKIVIRKQLNYDR